MASLATALRNSLAETIRTTLAGGSIKFKTSGGTVIVTCPFNTTAFGAASNGAIAMATSPNAVQGTVSGAGGTVSQADLCDSGGTAQINATADEAAANPEIVVSNKVLAPNDIQVVTNMTVTVGAN